MMVKKSYTIDIIGVPSDLGANMRGSCMGPAALRIAGLSRKLTKVGGHKVSDLGDISVPIRDSLTEQQQEKKRLLPLQNICTDLCDKTYNSLKEGNSPLIIGGDHSLAIGSISGISKYYREQNKRLGVVWVDAHSDINTPESSETGNIHGMPVSALLGKGYKELSAIGGDFAKLQPENIVLVGIRSIDSVEAKILEESGVLYFTMRDIDEKGMTKIMDEALLHLEKSSDVIHVSFDIDGVDPHYAPGVSTPVTGGISFRESHLLLERVSETGKLCSMDLVELNPYTDQQAKTAQFSVDLVLSAFGKSII